jgi:hypothetical protein
MSDSFTRRRCFADIAGFQRRRRGRHGTADAEAVVMHPARILLVAACFLGCAGDDAWEEVGESTDAIRAAPSVKAPKAGGITFGREQKERLLEVPMGKKAFDKPKVLFSVKLEDVSPAEDLLVRAELTFSKCGAKDISGDASDGEKNPCSTPELKRNPYSYDPHFGAYVVFGDSPTDVKGKRQSPVHDTRCSSREHHCNIIVPQTRVKSEVAKAARWVNLVVFADHDNARSHDLVIIEQTHGILAVTRLAPGAGPPVDTKVSKDEMKNGLIDIDREEGDGGPLGVDPKEAHELYQVKLTGLKPHDVISADAKFVAKLHGGPADCDPLFSTEILVTDGPKATGKSKNGDERVTQVNGVNCTEHGGGNCKYEKSGAVELGPNAKDTMFVTMVTKAGRTCVPPGFKWELLNDGFLEVNVRR